MELYPMKFLILMLALAGCDFYRVPYQTDASRIIWRDTYGATKSTPDVEWHFSPLSCADGQGFMRGSYYGDPSGNTCVLGVTWIPIRISEVAFPEGDAVSDTSLAHEFFHVYLNDTTGDPDSDHKNPGFGITMGYPHGIVDDANDALRVVGL
jgi:hypothetical protein